VLFLRNKHLLEFVFTFISVPFISVISTVQVCRHRKFCILQQERLENCQCINTYYKWTCIDHQLNAQFFLFYNNIYYIMILNMFRASQCPSSGGQIVYLQFLVSSYSVSCHTVHRFRAEERRNLKYVLEERFCVL
jgi:hypothetical protein